MKSHPLRDNPANLLRLTDPEPLTPLQEAETRIVALASNCAVAMAEKFKLGCAMIELESAVSALKAENKDLRDRLAGAVSPVGQGGAAGGGLAAAVEHYVSVTVGCGGGGSGAPNYSGGNAASKSGCAPGLYPAQALWYQSAQKAPEDRDRGTRGTTRQVSPADSFVGVRDRIAENILNGSEVADRADQARESQNLSPAAVPSLHWIC